MPLDRRWLALAVLLALPRLARVLHPTLWIEDDAYLYLGRALSFGLEPYRELPMPHLPLLEYGLSLLLGPLGAGLAAVELVTQALTWASALLLARTLAPLAGFRTAAAAGLLLSATPLLMRYHLWARELVALPLHVAAMAIVLAPRGPLRTRGTAAPSWPALVMLGTCTCLSMCLKLTNGVFWLALASWLLRRPDSKRSLFALALGLTAAAGCYLAVGLQHGAAFVDQTLLLHLVKGELPGLPLRLRTLLTNMPALTLLAIPGALYLRRMAPACGDLVLTWIGVWLVVHLLLSPTLWPHNAIDIAAPLAAAGGATLAVLAGADPRVGKRFRIVLAAGLTLALVIVVATHRMPDHGARSRSELGQIAELVTRCSSPDERVVSPALIAAQAGRLKRVHYRELAALLPTARLLREQKGTLGALVGGTAREHFHTRGVARDRRWAEELDAAIDAGAPPVVVSDLRAGHYPPYAADPRRLASHYRRVHASDDYEVWVQSDRAAHCAQGARR